MLNYNGVFFFKIEKFLKSSSIEVEIDNEVTDQGRYSPRFVDEIADEIDLIEDKKDTLFSKCELKSLQFISNVTHKDAFL